MDHTIKRNLSCRAMVNFSKNQVARVPRLLQKRNSCLDRMKASREALPCPALSGPVRPCPVPLGRSVTTQKRGYPALPCSALNGPVRPSQALPGPVRCPWAGR